MSFDGGGGESRVSELRTVLSEFEEAYVGWKALAFIDIFVRLFLSR